MAQQMQAIRAIVTYTCPKGHEKEEGYEDSSIREDTVYIDGYVECDDCED